MVSALCTNQSMSVRYWGLIVLTTQVTAVPSAATSALKAIKEKVRSLQVRNLQLKTYYVKVLARNLSTSSWVATL